ncbi:hypothetical protein GIHI108528_16450 [Gillisia hiemivivida]
MIIDCASKVLYRPLPILTSFKFPFCPKSRAVLDQETSLKSLATIDGKQFLKNQILLLGGHFYFGSGIKRIWDSYFLIYAKIFQIWVKVLLFRNSLTDFLIQIFDIYRK